MPKIKILNIITYPNPILRKKSDKIQSKDIKNKNMQIFIEEMSNTMLEKDGLGLAAPQVGKNIRLITVNTKYGVLAMINPEIISSSIGKEWDEEGCLSLPNIWGQVKRNKSIVCHFLDKNGEEKKIEAKGLLARIIQHETDHLNGVLFIDNAKDIVEK